MFANPSSGCFGNHSADFPWNFSKRFFHSLDVRCTAKVNPLANLKFIRESSVLLIFRDLVRDLLATGGTTAVVIIRTGPRARRSKSLAPFAIRFSCPPSNRTALEQYCELQEKKLARRSSRNNSWGVLSLSLLPHCRFLEGCALDAQIRCSMYVCVCATSAYHKHYG